MNTLTMETNLKYNKLKRALRPGFVFAFIIIAFTLLALVVGSFLGELDSPHLLIISVTGLLLSVFVYWLVNKNVHNDLKTKAVDVVEGVIQSKASKEEGIAGSGVLYIPILGDLFPSIWGAEMSTQKYYKVIINNTVYTLSEQVYNKIEEGDKVSLLFSKQAKILLDIVPQK